MFEIFSLSTCHLYFMSVDRLCQSSQVDIGYVRYQQVDRSCESSQVDRLCQSSQVDIGYVRY